MNNVLFFNICNHYNKCLVGGKNASLGELIKLSKKNNFNISNGFAITTLLYDEFIKYNKIEDKIINILSNINYNKLENIKKSSFEIKNLIVNSIFTQKQEKIIKDGYIQLCNYYNTTNLNVAVRSSAIAEDMPNASFAGQQDTYLNIYGLYNLLISIKKCFASLFNVRAISYRKTHNIDLNQVKISVGIQKMIRSDLGSAGVAFSIDPETGYNKSIVINSSFGLGELVVSGGVKPDEFILDKRILSKNNLDPILVKKIGEKNTKIIYNKNKNGIIEIKTNIKEKNSFSLNNNQLKELGRIVLELEKSYSELYKKKIGVDVEWALDGIDNKLYIIQTRPETIHSSENKLELCNYILKETSNILITGVSVGKKISNGKIKMLKSMDEYNLFNKGDILVTDMTTPDWEPLMKISSGIITNKGGRTCHAAIIARELGINAIVGTSNATRVLKDNMNVTVSCSEGEVGYVYDGILKFDIEKLSFDTKKKLPINLMLNVGNPENCFSSSLIPNQGVGLVRLEFIISNYIKIHPVALCNYPDNIPVNITKNIKELIGEFKNGKDFFINKLSKGISKIASAFYPKDVIVRLSDFKSNEYKNLIGGKLFEPDEENPMIGWRGASRYYSEDYIEAFELECKAINYSRINMDLKNIIVMIPFCRTPEECKIVLQTMEKFGLKRGENGLKVYIMCEIPSNVIEADNFSKYVDGVSIGGNDLLQLTLGIDRDSDKITYLSKHTNISYRRMISKAIKDYKKNNVKVGFCGQQPSDSVEFCQFLINEGIDSISVTPDSSIRTIYNL